MGNFLGAPTGPAAEASAGLRAAAGEQARLRGAAYERSRAAWAAGDRAAAKRWSDAAKEHAAKMQELNERAADAIYAANNSGRPPGEVDLHGLHVAEARARADAAISAARAAGAARLVLVVGRGAHSAGGVAKIRPAVERELVGRHSLRVTPGVPNEGCLLVEFVPAEKAGWVERVISAASSCVIC